MNKSKIQLWNTCFGNLFEHYDTALFGFLSPFLAPLIFPEHDSLTALILTYAIIPLGMLARPLGSLFFGYIGDTYGRNHTLFLTLLGMALVSGAIAFSPTYAQAGIFAPLIFCLGRALQNFFTAGETMGGAIYLLENSKEKHHDLLSSLYCCSTMGGHLLASLGVYLCSYHNIESGWRYLYLGGSITAIFACTSRYAKPTVNLSKTLSPPITALKDTLKSCRKPLLIIVLASGFAHATYSIALVLMNGFIPLVTSLTTTEVMKINTYMLIFDFCALPFFGWLATRMPREKLMLAASLAVIIFSIPLILLLQEASLAVVICIRAFLVIFGVSFFAPFHAWAQQLVPPQHRYLIISFGYALGSQLFGGPTAAFALWCYQQTGMVSSICWYWMALALACSVVLTIKMRAENKNKNWNRKELHCP